MYTMQLIVQYIMILIKAGAPIADCLTKAVMPRSHKRGTHGCSVAASVDLLLRASK
jgi:hypothetical protein